MPLATLSSLRDAAEPVRDGLTQLEAEPTEDAARTVLTRLDEVVLRAAPILATGTKPEPISEAIGAATRALAEERERLRLRTDQAVQEIRSIQTEAKAQVTTERQAAQDAASVARTEIAAGQEAMAAAVQQRTSEFVTAFDATKTRIDDQVTRLETALTTQAAQFAAAEVVRSTEAKERADQEVADRVERASKFSTELSSAEAALTATLEELEREAQTTKQERIVILDDLTGRARRVLGTAAASSVYGAFDEEAKQQRSEANSFRDSAVTILKWTAAFLVCLFLIDLVREHPVYQNAWDVVGRNSARTVLLGVLIGAATYAARQSGHHRKREQEARQLANELAAMFPFLSDLPEEKREDLLARLALRVFRGTSSSTDAKGVHDFSLAGPLMDAVERVLPRKDG